MATLIFLSYRKAQEERRRRNNPEEYAREQHDKEERLNKFIRDLHGDMEEDERDEEDEYEEYEDEEEEEEVRHVPPPPPQPVQQAAARNVLTQPQVKPLENAGDNFGFKPQLEEYKINTRIEQRKLGSKLDYRYESDKEKSAYHTPYDKNAYDVITTKNVSRVRELLKRVPSKKDMVVLHEIIGLPKGLK